MKALFSLLLFLFSRYATAYIEPAHWVIAEMARKMVAQNPIERSFKGMITSGKEEAFTDLVLQKNLQRKDKKERINLYFLDILYSCRGLLTNTCQENLLLYLKNAQINTSVISLGIFDNEPVYIIGAKAGDFNTPQLWVDKNGFYPVREKKSNSDFTWRKWLSYQHDAIIYPRLITIKIGDKITNISMH